MPETSATLERKAPGRVMGASASIALNDPFPVDQKGRKDLNLLSNIAARILATADIYYIYNLRSPGTCGEYSVFLKDKITQQLLPFASEFNKKDINQKGESKIYLYQNPNKVFDDLVTRKQICSELAVSIMRLVSTVVACLASIQYKEVIDRPTIETIMAPPKPVAVGARQTGGGRADVQTWFITFGYSSAPVPGSQDILLTSSSASYPNFVLKPVNSVGALSNWIIQVEPTTSRAMFPTVSPGGFRVQTIDPISIPGLPPGSETILPIRIYDTAATWVVGILSRKTFKPLDDQVDNVWDDFFAVLYNLFLRAAGQPGELPEKQISKVNYARDIFQRATASPAPILQLLTPYLRSTVREFNPAMIGASYGVPGPYGAAYGAAYPGAYPGAYGGPYPAGPGGYPGGGYGGPGGGYGGPGGGGPGGGGPGGGYGGPGGGPYSTGYVTPQARGAYYPTMVAAATGASDVPIPAVEAFLKQLDTLKPTFIENSCPAAIRAITLAAAIHADRTVSTNVCLDEFWKKRTLNTIYPYATLQVLCAEDLTKLGTPDPRNMSQTWVDFIEALRQVYPVVPAGAKTQLIPSIEPTNVYFLDQLGYRMGTLDLCKAGPTVTVDYPAVQAALIKINQSYTAHVAKMWDILNSLIVVIEDPDTKKDLVRLNPAVLQGSTKTYIDDVAKNAMKLIAIHYIEIEKIYTDVVKVLEPTKPLVK
jgi:hypothetical protein